MALMFVPHELKTIEVDTEKKIFRVNGEDFAKNCTKFSITYYGPGTFDIGMEIDTTVQFVRMENGEIGESWKRENAARHLSRDEIENLFKIE